MKRGDRENDEDDSHIPKLRRAFDEGGSEDEEEPQRVDAGSPVEKKAACSEEEFSQLVDAVAEYKRREYMYVAQCVQYEKVVRRLKTFVRDWRATHEYADNQIRTAIVDPAVNLEIKLLRRQLHEKENQIRQLEEEVQGTQFNPNSLIGKRLINKCKVLKEENADLGKLMNEGALQDLQIRLHSTMKENDLLRAKLREEHEFNVLLDKEAETLTETVATYAMQLQAEKAKNANGLGAEAATPSVGASRLAEKKTTPRSTPVAPAPTNPVGAGGSSDDEGGLGVGTDRGERERAPDGEAERGEGEGGERSHSADEDMKDPHPDCDEQI